MRLDELSAEQITELKQAYLQCRGGRQYSVSYLQLAKADELVTEKMLQEEYGHIDFCNDDFSCTAGK